tara:strand:+ start:10232 stop:11248 length:1017 start_codon:yes stop_codon:yes gene_type:complete
MSKKNSNVNLKSTFKNNKGLHYIYLNFKKKIDKFKNKRFLLAISGGPDSLALAALAGAYNFEKKAKFYFALVNHNIRTESATEAKKTKKLLKKHKINLSILTIKEKIIKDIQNQARKKRYEILKKFCLKKNIKVILTAHNLEDQVETFLIRLSRGSGLTGLSSMEQISNITRKIKLLRPLLDVKKKDLTKISKVVFGNYVKDPSNKNKKYLRSKIRSLRRPLHNSGINYDQIIKSINNLASSKATLNNYFKRIFKESIKKNKGEIFINFKRFKTYNNEIKIELINKCIKDLKKNYYNLRAKKVVSLINRIEKKGFKKSSLGKCVFFVKKGYLCLKKEK